MNDQELAAEARRVGAELSRRPGDLDKYAAELMKQTADRLDGRAATLLDAAAAEVRELLDANTGRRNAHLEAGGHDESVLQPIRDERLRIIDRLIASAAARSGHD